MGRRVLFAVSSHGFGHLGQTAPVIQALRRANPKVELIVRSSVPVFKLREKLGDNIEIQHAELDIGMIQKDALRIDFDKTAEEYARFHERWEASLCSEKEDLLKASPDLVVANIPYLTLAAAQQLNIPTIAFCSLNWADIYQYFFGKLHQSQAILNQMLTAYNQASCFLQPAPAMKMPGIENALSIGPVAEIGRDVSEDVRTKLALPSSAVLVLVSLGGMDLVTRCEGWPRFPGIRFLVPESWNSRHPDTCALETLGYPFTDLMRSCDVLIAKPGYGSFVEAACADTPVLYLPRPEWPEANVLIDWLTEHGTCKEIGYAEFQAGDLYDAVQEVMNQAKGAEVKPTGIDEALDTICRYLDE